MYTINTQPTRCLFIFFLVWLTALPGISAPGSAGPPLLSGPTTVCAGSTNYYSISGLRSVEWTVIGNGVIVSRSTYSCYVRWDGSGTIRATGYLPGNTTGEPDPGGDELQVNTVSPQGTISIGPMTSFSSGEQPDNKYAAGDQLQSLTTSFQCAPASAGLTLTNYSGTVVRWEKSTDRNYWEHIGTTSTYYQLSGIYATTYFRALLQIGSCSKYSSEAIVYITAPPAPPTVSSPARCGEGSVTLRPSGASGGSYYKFYDRNNGYVGSGATYTTPALKESTWYYVSVYSGGRCESTKTRVDVTINYTLAPGQPVSTEQYCGYTMLNYWPGLGPHYWQPTPNDTLTSNQTPYFRATANGTYYVKRKDLATGCWSPASAVTATVKYAPPTPGPFDVEQIPGCRNVTLSLANDLPLGIGYYWQNSADGTSMDRTGNVTVTTSGRHYLRAFSNECWSETSAAYDVTSIPANVSCLGNQNLNYVVTDVIKKEGVRHESQLVTLSAEENAQQVEYMDGFGRTIQRVIPQGSPAKKDIVHIFGYDALGRQSKTYLPFTTANNGRFNENALATLTGFYNVPQGSAIAATTRPWAETVFEASPLNRVKEQGSVGEAWQIGTGATIRSFEQTNAAGEVRLWSYDFSSGQCSSSSHYAAGELKIDASMDENGYKSWTYVDKDGNVVLTKKEVSATERALTYYVYDDFSRVRMIIQPEGVKEIPASGAWTPDSSFVSKWCFTYLYDKLGRITEKKTPGAEPVHLVYNKRHQVILTQDGEQRKRGEWSFSKYDALRRVILSGTHTQVVSRVEMQQGADAHALQFEERTAANYATQYGYTTGNSFPVLQTGSRIHRVYYYDDYNFDRNPTTTDAAFIASGLSPEPVPSDMTVNKITGVRTAVVESGQMLLTVNFYDKWGNVIQKQKQNHLAGTDVETSLYDFAGRMLETKHQHVSRSASLAVRKRFTYDHGGRLLHLQHQVNAAPLITLASYQYNELGQVTAKKLHSTDGVSYLQQVDQLYNIRGWLTKVNDAALTDASDLFGMELVYNDPVRMHAVPRYYNGNIAEIVYNDRVINKQRAYGFQYDRLDRLNHATYAARSEAGAQIEYGMYNEDINYDLNGNIRTLLRNGASGTTHDLQYVYSGNRLAALHNAANDAPGEPEEDDPRPEDPEPAFAAVPAADDAGNPADHDYTYNANGSLISDSGKGISGVTYNYLNLPQRIQMPGRGELRYVYDALGTRLIKSVVDFTGAVKTRHYVYGFEYNADGQIECFATEEGRVVMSAGMPEYQYHLRDHLGNVRVTFTSKPQTEVVTATLEAAEASEEQGDFLFLTEAVKVNHAIFDHTETGATQYATRLNGSAGERIGIARSISVMTGDVIRMEVFAKYLDPNRENWSTALTSLVHAVASGTTPAATIVDGGAAGSIGNNTFPLAGLVNKSTDDAAGPKAYLNYVIFDRNYTFRTGGFVRLSENARENGSNVPHERLAKEIEITEPGYLYVYLSNESDTPVDVYFDDFTVEQVKSMVVHTNDYYPFGMTFHSFSRENSVDQRYLFNGKEKQSELGLNWDDFGARMYDAETGRWNGVDPLAEKYKMLTPYAFVANNPVKYIDPDGREIWIAYNLGERVIRLQYKNGKLYNARGAEYHGRNPFVTQARQALDQLKQMNPLLTLRLHALETSEHVHTIEKAPAGSGSTAAPLFKEGRALGVSTGTVIKWRNDSETLKGEKTSPLIGLGHELLGHAYDNDTGSTDMTELTVPSKRVGVETETLPMREVDALNIENWIRAATGFDKKTEYTDVEIPESDLHDTHKTKKPKEKPEDIKFELR